MSIKVGILFRKKSVLTEEWVIGGPVNTFTIWLDIWETFTIHSKKFTLSQPYLKVLNNTKLITLTFCLIIVWDLKQNWKHVSFWPVAAQALLEKFKCIAEMVCMFRLLQISNNMLMLASLQRVIERVTNHD